MEDSKKKGVVLTTCSFDGLQQKHGRVLKRYKITPSSPLAAIRNRSVSVLASYVHGNGAVTKAEREMVKKRRDDDIRRQLAYNATQGNAVQIRTLIKHTAFSVDTRIDAWVDLCVDTCIGMRMDTRIDTCVELRAGMCMDTCVDIFADVQIDMRKHL